jgi:hypothetical protein
MSHDVSGVCVCGLNVRNDNYKLGSACDNGRKRGGGGQGQVWQLPKCAVSAALFSRKAREICGFLDDFKQKHA